MKSIELTLPAPFAAAASDSATLRRVRQFVRSHFPRSRDLDVADDASLLEAGVVNSLGILDIVVFIEDQFDLLVDDEELRPEYFDSVSSIARFVEQKRGRHA